jgi:hypothetical protein
MMDAPSANSLKGRRTTLAWGSTASRRPVAASYAYIPGGSYPRGWCCDNARLLPGGDVVESALRCMLALERLL